MSTFCAIAPCQFLLTLMPKLALTKLSIGILLAVPAVLYGLACLYIYLRQNTLIYRPPRSLDITPATYQTRYEEVWLSASTAQPHQPTKIHGWWLPSPESSALTAPSVQNPPTILYLHGNASTISANAENASRFHRMGYSVFLFDYRGFGLSDGDVPDEQMIYADAETAWRYLTETRGIAPDQIVIYGHSLGGAIALQLATRHPDAAGLIMESSFTSLLDVINRTSEYRFFPLNWLLNQRYESRDRIAYLQMPLFVIHGEADQRVPVDMGKTLYDLAPEPKQLWLVPDAEHNNTAALTGDLYRQRIRDFVERNTAKVPAIK
jgi:uncharacterized protein